MSFERLDTSTTEESVSQNGNRLKKFGWTGLFGLGMTAVIAANESQVVENGWAKAGVTILGLAAAGIGAYQAAEQINLVENFETRLEGLVAPEPASMPDPNAPITQVD